MPFSRETFPTLQLDAQAGNQAFCSSGATERRKRPMLQLFCSPEPSCHWGWHQGWQGRGAPVATHSKGLPYNERRRRGGLQSLLTPAQGGKPSFGSAAGMMGRRCFPGGCTEWVRRHQPGERNLSRGQKCGLRKCLSRDPP